MTLYVTLRNGLRETRARARLYHKGVDQPPKESDERKAKPKAAEPKRDKPDERPVDDKTPVTRFG